MVKSTKVTTKFCRKVKMENLSLFIAEYQRVTTLFIDPLWDMDKIPALLDKRITSQIQTWLSARALQAAGKQASAIVRGTKAKQSRRLWQINKFNAQGMFKKARKIQQIYNKNIASKPLVGDIKPELDSRFVKIDLDNDTIFDGWVTLSSLGNKLTIKIPFKKTKHFNKMLASGTLKAGVRLSKDSITFGFELEEPRERESGETLGIDIGQNSILSCSNGQVVDKDNHGHNYKAICQKLARKKKGSKGFRRAEAHRTNYINWSVNRLNIQNIKVVRRENIRNMRKGRKSSRNLSHWNYRELFEKLDSKLKDAGVQIIKVSPTYTSQRCFQCGWVRKGNRKGLLFKCRSCGYTGNSDLNASQNIALQLPAISREQRLKGINRTGFYWLPLEQECIVPVAQKTEIKS
jgi:IS605 OrfB family transposase